jgi:plasmid maintenance system killer protein
MIGSFADKETEKIFGRAFSRKLPADIQRIARRKLEILDAAENLNDLRIPLIVWRNYRATAKVSTAFASTINGEFALSGANGTLTKLRLLIIIEVKIWKNCRRFIRARFCSKSF